jgi:cap2 methyltransferase
MQAFKLHPVTLTDLDNVELKSVDLLSPPYIVNVAEQLSNTKTKIDKYYLTGKSPSLFDRVIKCFDFYKPLKSIIAKEHDAQCVTSVWMKFYEIISAFKMIPTTGGAIKEEAIKGDESKKEDELYGQDERNFTIFCNACFPGADILAINHYVTTRTSLSHTWLASSLTPSDKPIDGGENFALGDDYELFKNYPENWLMYETNNGDLGKIENILEYEARLKTEGKAENGGGKNTIDLYTSDLGFDVSTDYNAQEMLHAKFNFGQILNGILVLKKGGSMFTKQYTYFSPFSISILCVLSSLFTDVFICKPATSKATNSEIYIVCKDFKGLSPSLRDYLIEKFSKFEAKALFDYTKLKDWKEFCNSLSKSVEKIYGRQVMCINLAVKLYEKHSEDNQKIRDYIWNEFRPNELIKNWRISYPIKRLKDPLKVKNFVAK